MSNTKRNIKKEMMSVIGSEFNAWYASLSKEERLEYAFLIEDLKSTKP